MTDAAEKPVVDPKDLTTMISYCPHLDIYYYKGTDELESFFDTVQLEISIDTYLRQGNAGEADFMSRLTAWARKFPHKVAVFHADGRFEVRKLEPHKDKVEAVDAVPSDSTGPSK
jgi:hypothetical protein